MRRTVYRIGVGAVVVASLFGGAMPASADAGPAAAQVGGNPTTWSAECAAGLLAGLVAALTTGSSAAVGCPS
ncbi:hypothetical protein [Nocardia sp. NPDC052316]|uniref:hypothetical protein n=1 Tax=Nocardia sp. NPDC052316 TaxID=3364329 RepID=UPI0037C954A2